MARILTGIAILVGCGSHVTTGSVGAGGSGAGGGGGAQSCPAEPCIRFPAGDDDCAGGLLAYGCSDITNTPTACSYRISFCNNCIDWCCPADLTGLEPFAPAQVLPEAGWPLEGCTEVPGSNWMCQAQDKPLRAVHCGDPPDKDATGCIPSAYADADPCTGEDAETPLYCCP